MFVVIDATKDKHDCFIINSESEILKDVFSIENSKKGFKLLLQTINTYIRCLRKNKVKLETTGYYSYNLLSFLLKNGLPTYFINHFHTNLYLKSQSLRKTKTDRMDKVQ